MKKINVIVKVTDACNLRCKYCYNSESHYTREVLSLARFEKLLTLLAKDYQSIDLIWHGGEPLCAGLEFYQKAMEIEEKIYKETSAEISNLVQTNGTLINKEWVTFFKKYHFSPGISFDGVNNEDYRQQTDKTLTALDLLKKEGIQTGCLAVVADENYDVLENYKFFAEKGVSIAFSPMFNEGGGKDMQGVSAQYYVEQMKRLFDYWLYDVNGVTVKDFRSYVSMALGGNEKSCNNGSCLGKWLGITANGDIFNCGRDSMKDYRFGNIDEIDTIAELYQSEGFRNLLRGSIARRKQCMADCEYFDYCEGGCPDMAILENGLSERPGFSCECFIGIFSYVKEKMQAVFDAKTPLSQLNPTIRSVAVKCLTNYD